MLRAWSKAYYEAHREQVCARVAAHRDTHKEQILAYRKAHPRKESRAWQEWYSANRDTSRTYLKEYRAAHKSELAAYAKGYYQSDKGKEKAIAASFRHEERKRNAPGADYTTAAHIAARHELWGHRCYICGKPETKTERLQTDHVKPLAKGGAHLPCNLRPICKPCNIRKTDRWPYLGVTV